MLILFLFRKKTILDYCKMPASPMEKIEDHEHLRLIENGYKIVGKVVADDCISLDTYEDVEEIKTN